MMLVLIENPIKKTLFKFAFFLFKFGFNLFNKTSTDEKLTFFKLTCSYDKISNRD